MLKSEDPDNEMSQSMRKSENAESPEKSEFDLSTTADEEERDHFTSDSAYLFTAVGYAVGLGNIWRFPALAFKNGGSAFLIPYFCCTVFFGLPLFYLETFCAQYVQTGPSQLYFKYMPAFQGLGWSQTFLNVQVNSYYYIIAGWTTIYLGHLVTGNMGTWTRCDNYWNTPNCDSRQNNDECANNNSSTPFFFNGTCYGMDMKMELNMSSAKTVAAEEFYENFVLGRTGGLDELGGMNWKLLITMVCMWTLCALIIWKGVKLMGKISYVTTSLPYLIIVIFFFRGITLEGARVGLDYYLLKPDFSRVLDPKTWKAALHQVCMSLTVGYGGIQSMGSYNKRNHNCFKDAWIVITADAIMSIVGGSAVFCTMGYLATQQNKTIEDVVQDGFSLAFIAYPEAMAQMPLPWLWAFLFFLMLAVLGLSTVVVDAQSISSCLTDSSPYLQKKQSFVRWGICVFLFCMGIVMYTKGGIYWLTLMDECTGGIALGAGVVLELLVQAYGYGVCRLQKDIEEVLGKSTNCFAKVFGKSGWFFLVTWTVITPVLGGILVYSSLSLPEMSYGHGEREYVYPEWANWFGFIFGNISLLFIPTFFIINIFRMKKLTGSALSVFRPHPSHPSYNRIYGLEEEDSQENDITSEIPFATSKEM